VRTQAATWAREEDQKIVVKTKGKGRGANLNASKVLRGESSTSCSTMVRGLSPELRSWIDKCIVPILVKKHFAMLRSHKTIDLVPGTVTEFDGSDNRSVGVEE
jgi:hypothetical protein